MAFSGRGKLPGGAGVELLFLVGLDVTKAINNAATDFEEPRPLALPAPFFQRALGNAPAVGQFDLVKVANLPVFFCRVL